MAVVVEPARKLASEAAARRARRFDVRQRLENAASHLGDDELRVLALVAKRLAMGRRTYGELRLATDTRDWRREALDECADGLVYAACALAKTEEKQ